MHEILTFFHSGWGRIDATTHSKSSWLQKANITEVALNECQDSYKSINLSQLTEGLTEGQLCATSTKNGDIVDACQGILCAM